MGAPRDTSPLRVALLTLLTLLSLGAVVTLVYELAAARVPQHRAALEELIRHETGLEVRFAELSLRWGWHGPEVVFHGIELRDPGSDSVRLRAPRLSVALDAWRMVRSGQLEAGRITLQSPDIDLSTAGGDTGTPLPAAAHARPDPSAALRVLSRWRGGQMDIEGGTLRARLTRGALPVTLGIRRVQLRRLDDRWRADADLLLPEGLGTAAHLGLQMRGDPSSPGLMSGTLSLEGERLELTAWRTLLPFPQLVRYLPGEGNANLDLHISLDRGLVTLLAGRIRGESLAWAVPGDVLTVKRLQGEWQLARRGAQWQLSANATELSLPAADSRPPALSASAAAAASPAAVPAASPAATPAATLDLGVAANGDWVRGKVQHAPVAALAALTRFLEPRLSLGRLVLGGEARTLTFDWSAARSAGARLITAADVADLRVASAAGEVALSGLNAQVSGVDGALVADVHAPDGHLELMRDEGSFALDQLAVRARLSASPAPDGWRLSADGLEIRRQGASLTAHGTLGPESGGAAWLDARVSLRDADAAVLARVLGPKTLATLGAAVRLSAGRIESADVLWHGPLAGRGAAGDPGARMEGTLQLRAAAFSADDDWPDASGVDARLLWRGPRVHAVIERAQSGGFQLIAATADWNTQRADDWHFGGRLSGSAQQALGWLRLHPHAAATWAPGMSSIDLRGDTLLDLDVAGAAQMPRVRITAALEGGELSPLAGLPPIVNLRGTLAFASGRLQRSTFSGQWLGGPVGLGLAERHEHGAPELTISGHGTMAARQAVRAAGGDADQVPLDGSAEWSALLTYLPGAEGARDRWQLRADSNLVGLVSRLPEPLGKPAALPLPLRVELQAQGETGQLRIALAERLTALAALTRRGDAWRIGRGTVRLGGVASSLPAEPIVRLDGRVSRLDLVACLALLRQAAVDAALPPVHVRLSAAQLLTGMRSYPEVSVAAETSDGAGVVQLQGNVLSGSVRWPAAIDLAHPALVHLSRVSVAQLAEAASGAELAAVLAPAAQLFIDDLQWQGRGLGEFGATLTSRDDLLEARDAYLSGASAEVHGGARCTGSSCSLTFTLESEDAAATLAAFGLRPDMSANDASLDGELHWSTVAPAPLATLGGHLHMQLDDGTTRPGMTAGAGTPFGLLSVPALLAGLSPDNAAAAQAPLRFARVTADYDLRDGDAVTRDLHFDGDAEILLRGRVGLAAQDYDQQAWILRGEDRLPSALRRLAPSPKVATVWLSLRELFTGAGARAREPLRLRGRWDDPIVTGAE